MPRDIDIDEEGGFDIDEDTGDLASVTGSDYVLNRLVWNFGKRVDNLAGEAITETEILELKLDIEAFLQQDTTTDPPYTVSIDEYDEVTDTVSITVTTASTEVSF